MKKPKRHRMVPEREAVMAIHQVMAEELDELAEALSDYLRMYARQVRSCSLRANEIKRGRLREFVSDCIQAKKFRGEVKKIRGLERAIRRVSKRSLSKRRKSAG